VQSMAWHLKPPWFIMDMHHTLGMQMCVDQ
jgi:hypothetical protein